MFKQHVVTTDWPKTLNLQDAKAEENQEKKEEKNNTITLHASISKPTSFDNIDIGDDRCPLDFKNHNISLQDITSTKLHTHQVCQESYHHESIFRRIQGHL